MTQKKGAPLKPSTFVGEWEEARRGGDPHDYDSVIISLGNFLNMQIPERKFILGGLVMENSINVINGFRGSGKSWFAMSIGNEVAWGGAVGPWRVDTSVDVLLVDGEMSLSMIQERLKLLNRGRDPGDFESELFLYMEADAYRIGRSRANLLEPRWRDAISKSVEKRNVGLLILDNLSSLAPGIDENVKMEFDPINRWLLELRYSGVSVVMTHHTGKSGDQRGTTAHEDHVDVSLLLTKPAGYKSIEGCRFRCEATKDRAHINKGRKFDIKLAAAENGRLELVGGGTKFGPDAPKLEEAVILLTENPGMGYKEAEGLGISLATFSRAKKRILENEKR